MYEFKLPRTKKDTLVLWYKNSLTLVLTNFCLGTTECLMHISLNSRLFIFCECNNKIKQTCPFFALLVIGFVVQVYIVSINSCNTLHCSITGPDLSSKCYEELSHFIPLCPVMKHVIAVALSGYKEHNLLNVPHCHMAGLAVIKCIIRTGKSNS